MHEMMFAAEVNGIYQALYQLAARRVADLREGPSVETLALLTHLAQSGPLTLSEMSAHLQRALSTLSAKVAALQEQDLLARQGDPRDARRTLIWLSPAGRETVERAAQVLDAQRLAAAGRRLSVSQREGIVHALEELRRVLAHPCFQPIDAEIQPRGGVCHE